MVLGSLPGMAYRRRKRAVELFEWAKRHDVLADEARAGARAYGNEAYLGGRAVGIRDAAEALVDLAGNDRSND